MKIEILERLPVEVFYLRYTGRFGEPLGRFWQNTVMPRLAEHGLLDCPRYGVSLDNVMTTAPELCRYDACIEVPAGLQLPGAEQATIAGGAYAVTPFKGSAAGIGAAWAAFAGECIAHHESDPARPPFEHYPRGASSDARTGIFVYELCLPVSS